MSKRKEKKIDISFLMIWIVLFIFVLIVIVITNMINTIKNEESKDSLNIDVEADIRTNTKAIEKENNSELEQLKEMTERARIEHYVVKFISYIEEENYSEAYKLLNDTYKKNYFNNLNSFKEYAKSNFSKMIDLEFTNFERSGDCYVIWVTVTDAINGGPNSGKEMNFVVKEADYNDFELSFSAN